MEDALWSGLGKGLAALLLLTVFFVISLLFKGAKKGNRAVKAALTQREFFQSLARIAELRDTGVYDAKEFDSRKAALIAKLVESPVNRQDESFLVKLARFQRDSMLTAEDVKRIRAG